jgi:two-component system, OmpR family, sensor kinase
MRALFEATVGRRLLVRIWFHGVLLFAGVIATAIIARWVMANVDGEMAIRHQPYLASGIAERVLARADQPALLAAELARATDETPLAMSIYDASGRLVGSSAEPPLAATDAERAGLSATAPPASWTDDRIVVGAFRDGRLVGYAVVTTTPAFSIPLHVLALLGSALLLAFVFVAAPLARSIARPLERLRGLAAELGRGNLAVRANSERRDEIGDLARTFDAMAAQLQQLRASERQLLGDVSHELRTPLARMRVVLDLATDADAPRMRGYLGEITTDLAELEQLVDDIIVSARLDPETVPWSEARPPLRKTTIAIDEPIDAALARFRRRFPDRSIDDRRAGDSVAVDADATLVRRVLDNLLENACRYSPPDSPIAVDVEPLDGRVRVDVIDRGVGIAAADHDRVFSPFFRADSSRSRSSGGVGLGLVLARRIVEAHGGEIGFASVPEQGSRFWFTLDSAERTTSADRKGLAQAVELLDGAE